MKRFRFFFVALAAICLIACEKEPDPADYVVTITYEQVAADTIGSSLVFKAECGKLARPFIWWINGDLAYSISKDNGSHFYPIADENGKERFSLEDKSIKLYYIPGKQYAVKLRYYDNEYKEYYSEIIVDAPDK